MAVGDPVIIFKALSFVPAAGVTVCLTSFHNAGNAAYFGNSDNPITTTCTFYDDNALSSPSCKLFVTNTYPFSVNFASCGATGVVVQ